jgi:hypothetical protein
MRRTSKYFWVGLTLVAIYALVFFSVSFLINSGSNQINTMYVAKVNSGPNFANPGGESFWSGLTTYTVPMIDANSYPGSPAGHTSTVGVQMAWENVTGNAQLLIRMSFANYCPSYISPCGPSWTTSVPGGIPVVNNTSYRNGQLTTMYSNSSCLYTFSSCYGGFYPQDVGFLPLAIGSSYTYPEQASVMLGISPGAASDTWYAVSYKPKMVLGTTGALGTGGGGAAEMWLWSSNPTDNNSADTGYGGLSYPNGTAVSTASFGLPARASYAIDGYTNATSFYQLGGLPGAGGVGGSQFPYINAPQLVTNGTSAGTSLAGLMNPFEVQAKSNYNSGTWTLEFVRALTTPSSNGENAYQLQMDPTNASNYHISFAVSQGQASQTYLLYYNSVSFWWSFNFVSPSGFNLPAHPNPQAIPLTSILLAAFVLSFVVRKKVYSEQKPWQVSSVRL